MVSAWQLMVSAHLQVKFVFMLLAPCAVPWAGKEMLTDEIEKLRYTSTLAPHLPLTITLLLPPRGNQSVQRRARGEPLVVKESQSVKESLSLCAFRTGEDTIEAAIEQLQETFPAIGAPLLHERNEFLTYSLQVLCQCLPVSCPVFFCL